MSVSCKFIGRKRGLKVNSKQKKILLQFMADYPLIYLNKVTNEFTEKHHKSFWANMTAALNIFGPPIKTLESWKKAWKDLKLRYKKAGIDVKQLMDTIKNENVINTQVLLDKVEKMNTSKGKVEIDFSFKESDNCLSDLIDSDCKLTRNIESKNINYEHEIPGLIDDIKFKNEKLPTDDNCEEFYEVEEVVDSDYEDLSEKEFSLPISIETVLSKDSKININCNESRKELSSDSNSDSESEIKEFHLIKKQKLSESHESVAINSNPISDFSNANVSRSEERTKNGSKKNIFTELLQELKLHNALKKEEVILKTKHYELEKLILQNSLGLQKDMAKSHAILANSVKTFVDNISYNL